MFTAQGQSITSFNELKKVMGYVPPPPTEELNKLRLNQ
jgi:hypothetical protein